MWEEKILAWTTDTGDVDFSWITKFTALGIGEFERFDQTMIEYGRSIFLFQIVYLEIVAWVDARDIALSIERVDPCYLEEDWE